jgi:hypothetical protein
MKSVWVFAEERSGSTWTAITLSEILGIEYEYVEWENENITDTEWNNNIEGNLERYSINRVYHTHRYPILEVLHKLKSSTVLIRTTRKDTFEQLLSYVFMERSKGNFPDWWKIPHLYRDPPHTFEERKKKFYEMVSENSGITITKEEVEKYLKRKKWRGTLWDTYSLHFEHQTLFYEDLYNGVQIPSVKIDDFGFNMGGIFVKLPYDKKTTVTNSEQVLEWITEINKTLAIK